MTDLVSSQFVSPSPRAELNGELGLDLHEIAQSLGAEFKHVKAKLEKDLLDYPSSAEISTQQLIQEVTGHSYTKEVKSYILNVEDAKFFVAGYNNEIGKAYRRHLIQCEKKLTTTAFQLETMFTNPEHGVLVFQKMAQLKSEKESAEIRAKQAEATKAQISSSREAKALGKLSAATKKIKALEALNERLSHGQDDEYVPYDAYRQLRNTEKLSNHEKSTLFKIMESCGMKPVMKVIGGGPYPTKCFKVSDFDRAIL